MSTISFYIPHREGARLVTTGPVLVNGGGAGHGVQVVRAARDARHPVGRPLSFGIPETQ